MAEQSPILPSPDFEDLTPFNDELTRGINAEPLASCLRASGYLRATDLLNCGFEHPGTRKKFSCGDTRLCRWCSFLRVTRQVIQEFAEGFLVSSYKTFALTLSLNRTERHETRLRFFDPTLPQDEQIIGSNEVIADAIDQRGLPFFSEADIMICRLYLELFREILHDLTGQRPSNLFDGIFFFPEVAISLTPQLMVRPHVHGVIWSSGFAAVQARQLRSKIAEKLRNCRPLERSGNTLYPSLWLSRLTTQNDFFRFIAYSSKPISLRSDTQSAIRGNEQCPQQIVDVIENVTVFLRNVSRLFRRLPRISAFGICSSRHRNYIGKATSWRQNERLRVARNRKRAKSKNSLITPPESQRRVRRRLADRMDEFEANLHHENPWPKSRFEYWFRNQSQ